jgi:hypothetical protein
MGGGKSGSAQKTYNYFGTLAGGVCIGPNEDLVAIILNSQEVWPKGTPWAVGLSCVPGTLYVFDAQTWTCTTGHTASNANAPGSGLEGWTEYVFTRGGNVYDDFSLTASDGTIYGVMRFYWGTTAQTVDDLLGSTGNDGGVKGNLGFGDQHPDYEGVAYVVVRDFLLGQEVQSGPNIEIVVRRKPNQSVVTGAAAGITEGQANLAAVAAELLKDANCLGLPSGMVDSTSFQAVADWLQTYQAKYGASVLIDASESITSLFDKICQMIDGYIRFNPATQKVELGVYQHGIVPASYTTLTADSFTKFPKLTVKSWQDTISRATVRYNSRQLNYQQTSVQVDDPRAFAVLGTVREQSLDRPWIARDAQAQTHGRETLRVVGHAQMTGELEVRREIGRAIRAGDYVLVDVDLEPNTNSIYQYFRITSRKIPPTGPITLSVFADNTLALVPWTGPGSPVMTAAAPMPPITSFRFLEAPPVLSGLLGSVLCLAQRPNDLLVGATLYFDTNPAGTFSSLGSFSGFAAKATLHTALTTGAATLDVDVDTTQVDADYFTLQYSANDAANDTFLAFVVSKVASGGDAGQVAESSGYQIMEICSVSAQSLTSAGRYSLSVLRGRMGTSKTAFSTANTEVWVIPAALLDFFYHQLFATIIANRAQGLTPAYAQFRLCPFTFVNSLALSDAATFQFRFPLVSSGLPTLSLTSPASYTLAYSSPSYPLKITVAGTWTDQAGNLVEIQVLLRLSTESSDRPVYNDSFPPIGSKAFSTSVQIEKAGSWLIKIIARDASNISTERDITVTVTGAGGKCAPAQIYDVNGDEVVPGVVRVIPYGPLTLKCQTPGAVIQFNTGGPVLKGGVITANFGNLIYSEGVTMPIYMPATEGTFAYGTAPLVYAGAFMSSFALILYVSAPGLTSATAVSLTMQLALKLS